MMTPDDALAFMIGVLAFLGLSLVESALARIPGDPAGRLGRWLFRGPR